MRVPILVLCWLSFSQISNGQDLSTLISPLEWDNVGPNRGGRSIAVAGSNARPNEYYFGATGGGLWKTNDGGTNWLPVTDGQINSSSVGAVAVAPSNPDIVYLGMGEAQLRGNVMQGDGIYLSSDAGKSWKHMGLAETQVISRIQVHPQNPEIAFVAALGNPYGPNEDRGIFRTGDGGKTWQKVLYRDNKTGAIDLIMDPNDANTLYASFWQVYRKPWILWSGGEGSSLYKSTDGGENWQELTAAPGLPKGVWGKVTVTLSAANSNIVYANIEASEGGLYRSDDAGRTWRLVNNHRDLWQRAFYFLRIKADPTDAETIYVLNFILLKSTDGGKTFETIRTPHADHHDLWIDPTNSERMIVANDGGGAVSVNGGKTWTEQDYPTAQIYRLELTSDYPYHLCGAQQDNTTVCVSSSLSYWQNPRRADAGWYYAIGGGENAYIANHPTKPNIFFSGATNRLTRYNRATDQIQDVQPYPFMVMGEAAREMPERWNWVYPIVFSPLPPHRLYIGSQHLWESADEGKTWQKISKDLTRSDPATLGDSGGPIVKDQDGPEIYGTLYTIAPSYHDPETIWTGSDDGLVQVTRDKGNSWVNVTPPDLPEHSRVGLIAPSRHNPGTAYFAARRYEMSDRQPYVYKTSDYGQSWTKIINGIEGGHFAHIIAEDPEKQGLLYLGTEHGVYASIDDGANWFKLKLNLPDVQVSGIRAIGKDLVIATHGRSFWILPDVHLLRQANVSQSDAKNRIFNPGDFIRRNDIGRFHVYLNTDNNLRAWIEDSDGKMVANFNSDRLTTGMNTLRWNLRYPGATVFPGMILEGPSPARGPNAPPGLYYFKLNVNGEELVQAFRIAKDPRLKATDEELQQQFDLAIKVRDLTSQANESVIMIRNLRSQIDDRLKETKNRRVLKTAEDFKTRIGAIEAELYQVRNQSPKDKIAFPIKLNNRLSGLMSIIEFGDGAPNAGAYQIFAELESEMQKQMGALENALKSLTPLSASFEKAGLQALEIR